ncbi:MAG: putative secreted protein [Polyangiaceae bacterium]|nr:putative secreted protein [Polyangiaceae bacterium]
MRAFLHVVASGALLFPLACGSSDETPPSSNPQGGTTSLGGTAANAGTAGQVSQGGAGSPAGGQGTTAGSMTGGTASAGTSAGGTGGAAAGSGGGGTNTGGAGGPCGAGSIFCTDFNAAAIPAELLYYPEYERATQKTITLDSTVARGASGGSLKVVGSGFSQMLGVAVPSKFWGRVYLRSATDIQMGHNTYVAAGTETGDPNAGEYVRIGEHQCQLELNRKSDDKELLSNGGMYMCSGGIKLVKDTWYCLEFSYDGPGKEVRVFVDNMEVTALHATDWGPYDYKIFKLGFEKYHGMEKTLWYDDLALAAERVPCSP